MRAVLLIPLLALSAGTSLPPEFEFTFGNPTLGYDSARFRLEYFVSSDCNVCGKLEETVFPDLARQWIQSGNLQLVFRDLPSEKNQTIGLRAFCRSHSPNYLSYRNLARKNDSALLAISPPESRRERDRYQQCLNGLAAMALYEYNQSDFKAIGLRGTPGFRLLDRAEGETHLFQGADSLNAALKRFGMEI